MRRLAQSFLARIEALVERGRASRARILEDTSLERVDASLLDETHSLLADTLRLLVEAEPSLSEAGAGGTRDPAGWAVASDLAWLGRGEVRSRLESLKSSEELGPAWRIVSEADSALERAERALLALEGALRDALGLPPTERTKRRLRESLEVRRLYAALRRSILQARSPEAGSLETELWVLSRQLEAFQTVATYGVVRVEDRRQIRSLSERIDSALADRSRDGESDRRTLWHDLDTFSRLLMAIHERDDLRTHDLALVRNALESLREGDGGRHELLAELRCLLGRDEDLDRMLLDPASPADPDALAPILERLESDLRQRTGG